LTLLLGRFAKSKVKVTSAEPSIATLPVAAPVTFIVLAVFHLSAPAEAALALLSTFAKAAAIVSVTATSEAASGKV